MYKVAYLPRARKELLSLPEAARQAIGLAVDSLRSTPRPHGAQKLAGKRQALYRLRVGRYRLVYEVRDQILLILIVRIAKRDEATYRGI